MLDCPSGLLVPIVPPSSDVASVNDTRLPWSFFSGKSTLPDLNFYSVRYK